ncbi:MAG TPA: efflux RND transporter periplasmic adaptor subunit [Gemmata sp.]|jgi:RND family efflux transporter MFP subunit|nr:efflux RND transporter periplasmic adaptor subunit [Gemmata sp.]
MRFAALLLATGLVLASVDIRAAGPQKPTEPPKPSPGNALDFTGRTEAATVEIHPRVTGLLLKILVKEGATVKQGDVLAEIDSRQYKADLDVAKAKLAVAEAGSKLTAANLVRLRSAIRTGVISKEDVTQAEAEQERSEALVKVAKAEMDLAELTLSWTKLTAPMDGKVGRFRLTPGNLVTSDGPALVVVVATDPQFVAFDVDERTILKLRRDGLSVQKLTATAGLADEDGFPHMVVVDFIDPQFNPATGTVRVRGVLANPNGLISPGMFIRVHLALAAK